MTIQISPTDALGPRAIAALGAWSWDDRRPGWLRRKLLTTPSADVRWDCFYHPSSGKWDRPWDAKTRTAAAWGNETWRNKGVRNRDAFIKKVRHQTSDRYGNSHARNLAK